MATSAVPPVAMKAAPTPCTTRAARSIGSLKAIPHATEATRNTALPANMHASAAEAIGERAGRQEGTGERKTIGVDDPGQARDIQPDVLRDGGHGDDDRRHIEQDQEGA